MNYFIPKVKMKDLKHLQKEQNHLILTKTGQVYCFWL